VDENLGCVCLAEEYEELDHEKKKRLSRGAETSSKKEEKEKKRKYCTAVNCNWGKKYSRFQNGQAGSVD